MCGPSAGLKAVNTQIQNFGKDVASEAKTVFGDASTVFNNMIGGLQKIVDGGPSQMGFSQAEINAKNAAIVNGGATMARNLKGVAASGVAAIGGGNTPTTSGGTQASVLSAEQIAAEKTAEAENQVVSENFDRGNQNYKFAVGAEQALPRVFDAATSMNNSADKANNTSLDSQKEMDKQANWWQPMVTAAIGGAAGLATGGGLGSFLKMGKKSGGGGGAPQVDNGTDVSVDGSN